MNTTVPMWLTAINIWLLAIFMNRFMLMREMRMKGWTFHPISQSLIGRFYMISAQHQESDRLIMYVPHTDQCILLMGGKKVGRLKTTSLAKAAKAFDRHCQKQKQVLI